MTYPLTKSEAESLSLWANGKTAFEIAKIRGLSSHTVRDHLKAARYKLDCVKTGQAAIKAAMSGIIQMSVDPF